MSPPLLVRDGVIRGCLSPLLVLLFSAEGVGKADGAGKPLRSNVVLLVGVAATAESSLSATCLLTSETLELGLWLYAPPRLDRGRPAVMVPVVE